MLGMMVRYKPYFLHQTPTQSIKNQICSVLAGYVWDTDNPFVKKHSTAVAALAKVISYETVGS
jgi:hypothetical protein